MDKICANPFVVNNKYSILDYAKIGIMTIPALIRLFFFCIFMISSGVTAQVLYYIRSLHKPKDYVKWKKYYTFIPVFCIRCAMFCLGFFKINVIDKSGGSDSSSKKSCGQLPIQLLTPHSSIYDFFAVTALGLPVFVTRKEMLDVWVVSNLVALGNPITVNRGEMLSRKEAMEVIKQRSQREQLLIFPEGTNTNREMIIRFRVGAFMPGLPVQPVILKFPNHKIDSYSWAWEGPSATMGFFLTSCKLFSSMSLIKLPTYTPSDAEKEDPCLFAANVQKYIAQLENIRISSYSYEDTPFLKLALRANTPRSPLGLKVLKLCRKMVILNDNRSEEMNVPLINGVPLTELSSEMKDSDWNSEDLATLNMLQTLNKNVLDNWENASVTHIKSTEELVRFLGLASTYPELPRCATTQEILTVLKGSQETVSTQDIVMALTLCDNRKWHMWDRIRHVFVVIKSANLDKLKSPNLSQKEFRRLIWYLLGLEENSIDTSILKTSRFNYSYLRQQLVPTFRRAVEENARDLLIE